MAVDEAGEGRCAGEVDDFGGFWRVRLELRGGADFLDALAFDEDGGVFEVAAGADVEKAGGLDEDDVGRFCVGSGLGNGERSVEGQREDGKGKFFRHRFSQHGRGEYHKEGNRSRATHVVTQVAISSGWEALKSSLGSLAAENAASE